MAALRAEITSLRQHFAEALQAGLSDLATRTEARLDQLAGVVDDRVVGRLETAASDLRRTLTAALEVQVDSAAITQASALDTRSALESRAVVLEEALGAVSERVEVLNREGIDGTRQQLRMLASDIASLRQSADPVEALRRRAEAQGRLEAALDGRDKRLVNAVGELLAAVTGERLATRTTLLQLEDITSRILDALLPLENRITAQAADVATHSADLLVGLQEGFDAIRVGVGGQLGRMREELSAEMSAVAVNAALAVEAGGRDRAAMLERMGEHRNALITRMDQLGDLIVTADELPGPRLRARAQAAGGGGTSSQPATAASTTEMEALVGDLRGELGRLTTAVESLVGRQPPAGPATPAGAGRVPRETPGPASGGKIPVRKAPATKAPATKAPATKAPATKAPATQAPARKAPARASAGTASTTKTAAKTTATTVKAVETTPARTTPAARPSTSRPTPRPTRARPAPGRSAALPATGPPPAGTPTAGAKAAAPRPTPRATSQVSATRSRGLSDTDGGTPRTRPSPQPKVFPAPPAPPPARPSPRTPATAPEAPSRPTKPPNETGEESKATRRLFPFRRY